MAAEALVHIIVAFVLQVNHLTVRWVSLHGFVLLLLLLFNLAVNLWDTRLRHLELLMKAEKLLELIKNCTQNRDLLRQWKYYSWQSSKPHKIFVPQSPCIHQQLTYRDKSCVNLPVYLLVIGDIIRLYPGDKAPGQCMSIRQSQVNPSTIIESSSEQVRNAKSMSPGKQQSKTFDNQTNQANNNDVILLKEGELFTHEIVTGKKGEKRTKGRTKANNNSGHCESQSRIIPSFIKHDNESTVEKYFGQAKLKKATDGVDFVMLSTPYIQSLKVSLRRSHDRPLNSVEKECFTISRKYFETLVIPLVFLFSTLVTAIHYGYLDLTDSDHKIKPISLAYLLLRPALTIMPFLPWMFPSLWLIINAYGSARLLCCRSAQPTHHASQSHNCNGKLSHLACQQKDGSAFASDTGHSCNPPATDSTDNNKINDESLNELKSDIKFNKIFKVFLALITGQEGYVWRSSSLLQVLGSLTSLCCIDKVGILSWPNPSPEKVFFLTTDNNGDNYKRNSSISHNQQQRGVLIHSHSAPTSDMMQDDTSLDGLDGNQLIHDGIQESGDLLDNDNDAIETRQGQSLRQQHQQQFSQMNNCQVEVLDVTHNYNCDSYERDSQNNLLKKTTATPSSVSNLQTSMAGMLQFDDSNWQRYLNNLKPLGLSILMNNCCRPSLSDYYRFYKHISSQSAIRGGYTPVVKRRCLCQISKLIGFSKSATSNYAYCNQLALFRLIDPELFKKGKLASSLQNTIGLKLPFPNMTCNVFKDTISGSYQIFSQGTADLILDSCAEYWDGQELYRLTDTIRKKILDFYQRTSLTSYCSAFSYAPLSKKYNFKSNYVEIQPDNSRLGSSIRRLSITHETLLDLFDNGTLRSQSNNQSNNYDRSTLSSGHHHLHPTINSHSYRNSISLLRGSNQRPFAGNRLGQHHLSLSSLDASVDSDLSAELRVLNLAIATNVDNDKQQDKDSRDLRKPALSSKRRLTKNIRFLDLNKAMDEVTDQVFVGMIAMQYQACPDFVALVEQLEQACIRFVHFSKENELRSRVFSEKMGLESGWNCHISLMSDEDEEELGKRTNLTRSSDKISHDTLGNDEDQQQHLHQLSTSVTSPLLLDIDNLERDVSVESGLFIHNYRQHRLLSQQSASSRSSSSSTTRSSQSDDENSDKSLSGVASGSSISRWMSVPSLIMHMAVNIGHHLRSPEHHTGKKKSVDHSTDGLHHHQQQQQQHHHHSRLDARANTITGVDELEELVTDENGIPMKPIGEQETDNCLETDQFEAFAFDMSNRAKLPKGIENIRPHLDTVDNVPLQVSLFTDCTPELTHEMIKIMQDYGEIVCVIGSASSKMNTPVFLQANASIGIAPLEPQICLSVASMENHHHSGDSAKKGLNITDTNGDDSGFSVDGRHNNNDGADQHHLNNDHSSRPMSKKSRKLRAKMKKRLRSKLESSSPDHNNKSPLLNKTTKANLEQTTLDHHHHQEDHRIVVSSSSSSSSSNSDDSDDDNHYSSSSSSSSSSYESSSSSTDSCSSPSSLDEDYDDTATAAINSNLLINQLPSPSALATKLASLPCSFSFSRKDPISLHGLIMEARHYTFKMKNCFVCMICFALSLSSAQFLTSILFLPPMLSSGLTIWLTVVVVPLMGFSLMGTAIDSQVMKIAVGKNLQLKPEVSLALLLAREKEKTQIFTYLSNNFNIYFYYLKFNISE